MLCVQVGLIGGLTYACRLETHRTDPTNSAQRVAFVVRASVSATLQVLLATPSSILVQDPVRAAWFLWIVAVMMVLNVFMDVHFQNRSLKVRAFSSFIFIFNLTCFAHRQAVFNT